MGEAAADGTAVRLHGLEGEAAAAEDAAVSLVHGFIGALRPGLVNVEAVGVLHDKLAAPDEPEAGPDFVPELHLDLIQVQGELAVGVDFPPHQVGDHLFVGGAETAIPAVAVLEAQQFLAVNLPAPRLLPQFGRLHGGEQHFLGSGPVHFLPDDGLHLA